MTVAPCSRMLADVIIYNHALCSVKRKRLARCIKAPALKGLGVHHSWSDMSKGTLGSFFIKLFLWWWGCILTKWKRQFAVHIQYMHDLLHSLKQRFSTHKSHTWFSHNRFFWKHITCYLCQISKSNQFIILINIKYDFNVITRLTRLKEMKVYYRSLLNIKFFFF